MPESRKRKCKRTGRPVSWRPASGLELARFGTGIPAPMSRCIDDEALREAIYELSYSDASRVAHANRAQLMSWADTFAAERPDDARWDAWRRRRAWEMSSVS
jgi:hypothetical protein